MTFFADSEERRRYVDWSIIIANSMFILLLFGAMVYLGYAIHVMQIESAARLEHAAIERSAIREESQQQRRAVMDINAAQTRILMHLSEQMFDLRQTLEAKAIANN